MVSRVEREETIHEGRVFRLCREHVILPGGVEADFDVIHHPGSSAIVALLPDDQVVMVKQYRQAIGEFIWEIPAGTLDPGEDPLECARRELIEETGYRAGHWEKIIEILPAPGYTDERIHLFSARDLQSAPQNLDRDEVLEVVQLSRGEALAMIQDGRIQDALTIIGLFQVLTGHHGLP